MNVCTCFWVPEHLWTTHYGAVEPGSQREWDPRCPEHGEANPLVRGWYAKVGLRPPVPQFYVVMPCSADRSVRILQAIEGGSFRPVDHWSGL